MLLGGIFMKKALAVILAIVMLLSTSTFCSLADETPKVSIVTNQGSSIVVNNPTCFTVKFDNFTTIKGMDVVISVTNATDLDIDSASGFTFAEKITETKGENYKTDGATLKLVDLTGKVDGKLTFNVTPTAVDATVSVKGTYAKSGTELALVADATAKLDVVKPAPDAVETENAATSLNQPNDDTFIPYGSVVDSEGNMVAKETTGSFTLDPAKKYLYSTFKKPSAEDCITTYGVTNEIDNKNNLRFGTYSILPNDTYKHGTLVFEGDWDALMKYYIKKGYSVQEFVKAIYKNAITKINGYDFVKYTIPGAGDINVYIVPQTKVMWQSGNNLEYAVRVNGANANTTYTGIAYSYSDTDIKISDNARSVKIAAAS